MTTLIQDLGTFMCVETKQRVTAHKTWDGTGDAHSPHHNPMFLTVPERHPYPCFNKPLYLGIWDAKEFAARFTRTCNT